MGRLGARAVLAVALGAQVASCGGPGKGSVTLAISTDMQTPKDLDLISVFITTNGTPKLDYIGRVLPDGTVSLPSTLAIVEPDDPSAQVRIRVIAFQTQPDGSAKARVMRDVLTTVPHQRSVLLRVPLSFLDDGRSSGTLPASLVPGHDGQPEGDTTFDPLTVTSVCDFTRGETSVAGSCASALLDSGGLPGYADGEVFGEGGTAQSPACFDVQSCFAQAAPVSNVDLTRCSFPVSPGEDGKDWNCALATTDGTGKCFGATCLVPLESDPSLGFTVQPGVRVQMVAGVCKKLQAGASLVLNQRACATRTESTPVCQPTGAAPAVDAAAPEAGAADAAADGALRP